jgi:hypothetical protein
VTYAWLSGISPGTATSPDPDVAPPGPDAPQEAGGDVVEVGEASGDAVDEGRDAVDEGGDAVDEGGDAVDECRDELQAAAITGTRIKSPSRLIARHRTDTSLSADPRVGKRSVKPPCRS